MQIIAHRGASALAPENTLKAIGLAQQLGARAIEIDVQVADGELWVFHDRRLERCTNGNGVLTQQSGTYLRTLDAGEGEPIPTLWQVMTLLAGTVELHIELKGPHTAHRVAALTCRAEVELGFDAKQWVVSSFDHAELALFQQCRPEVRCGMLIATLSVGLVAKAVALQAWSINCDVKVINQQVIDAAHASGLRVLVYTVDEIAVQMALVAIGVDGIFTNQPDRFLAVTSVAG
jgi:glycerophosphoryl diester phosphodiesterase